MHRTVVLLPGLLCDQHVWQRQRAALRNMDCIVPDYGHLDSIEAMARLVLSEVKAPRFALAGHSMGGRVALEMVRLAPERIERLALLDTGFQARVQGEEGDAEVRERLWLLTLARERGMCEMGLHWIGGMVHPMHLDSPVFDSILAMIDRKTPEIFEAQTRALLDRPDGGPVLQTLRCPTMLLCGRQYTSNPLAGHEQMRALAPRSELVVVENAAHMTMMEQPQAVSAALLRWLGMPLIQTTHIAKDAVDAAHRAVSIPTETLTATSDQRMEHIAGELVVSRASGGGPDVAQILCCAHMGMLY